MLPSRTIGTSGPELWPGAITGQYYNFHAEIFLFICVSFICFCFFLLNFVLRGFSRTEADERGQGDEWDLDA